jgi:hypothetical protein
MAAWVALETEQGIGLEDFERPRNPPLPPNKED